MGENTFRFTLVNAAHMYSGTGVLKFWVLELRIQVCPSHMHTEAQICGEERVEQTVLGMSLQAEKKVIWKTVEKMIVTTILRLDNICLELWVELFFVGLALVHAACAIWCGSKVVMSLILVLVSRVSCGPSWCITCFVCDVL